MPKRSSKPRGDANVIGFLVAQVATGSVQPDSRKGGAKDQTGAPEGAHSGDLDQGREAGQATEGKNPAAVALGRLGGLKGGKARADALSAKKRSEIARKAAQARWKRR